MWYECTWMPSVNHGTLSQEMIQVTGPNERELDRVDFHRGKNEARRELGLASVTTSQSSGGGLLVAERDVEPAKWESFKSRRDGHYVYDAEAVAKNAAAQIQQQVSGSFAEIFYNHPQ